MLCVVCGIVCICTCLSVSTCGTYVYVCACTYMGQRGMAADINAEASLFCLCKLSQRTVNTRSKKVKREGLGRRVSSPKSVMFLSALLASSPSSLSSFCGSDHPSFYNSAMNRSQDCVSVCLRSKQGRGEEDAKERICHGVGQGRGGSWSG